ncbi:MAG: 16S rRNA (cytidine(1402)-2'-O)-methyltransferase [Firmicutes bacterium]|nr:16S rRNA (cytidine(1402)-2'-O)-methyltransferase [Bacillota bacterium]
MIPLLRQKSFTQELPTLYLVPTPIGNLEDMTLRSIRILKESKVIFAEDTRVSQKLLSHYQISGPLKSYHEHNKHEASDEILTLLKEGNTVALISDAGMPLLSDPGFEIVKRAREQGFHVVALPGANAVLTGLVTSGIQVLPFTFLGFLDPKKTKRLKELEDLKYRKETLVFYEAPHRLKELLEDMYTIFGNRVISITRELTKTFEEIIHGPISECMTLEPLKGEMVIVVSGNQETEFNHSHLSIVDQVDFFIKDGLTKTEAMKRVSALTGLPKNKIYQDYLQTNINPKK